MARLTFKITNNEAEYKALLVGLSGRSIGGDRGRGKFELTSSTQPTAGSIRHKGRKTEEILEPSLGGSTDSPVLA